MQCDLTWFLMLVTSGLKHIGNVCVVIPYKYLRENIIHFVG